MNVNNDVDSESELDEKKRKEQVTKKQEHKKTLKDSRAAMEDSLYRMINESGCARKIILSVFDEPDLQDLDKWPTAPRPKAKKFERLAIVEDLENWRDRVRLLEFKGNRLAQGGQCKFLMSESIMKSISRDATAFADVNGLRQVAVKWPARWLNKVADEVFEVALNRPKASKKPLTVATELESAASTATPGGLIGGQDEDSGVVYATAVATIAQ
ncbi:hypothetical protein MMC22_002451 [Lobaria immixta]|nr:hypothetical protein [Lobaria immixta]